MKAELETVQTGDIWFCAACLYVYDEEVLVRIDNKVNQWNRDVPTFYLEVPLAKEVNQLQNDFQSGQCGITDLKSYIRTFTYLQRLLREMRKAGTTTWTR